MKRACIFDLGGTLANCTHRRHFVEQEVKDWKNFLDPELIIQDDIFHHVAELARQLNKAGNYIIICSGRNQRHKKVSEAWLKQNQIPFHKSFFRPDDDFRGDEIVKIEFLTQIRAENFEVWLVIDDRKKVVDAWRAAGLTCLQAADGDF